MGDRDRYQSNWDRDENRHRDDQSRERTDEWRSRERDWTSGRDYGSSNRDYSGQDRDYGSRDFNASRNRDFSRDYNYDRGGNRDTERQYGSQYPERNYGQGFSGFESRRFPGTFGSSDDQRFGREWSRDRSSESERNYGSPYGAGRQSRSGYSDWSPYGASYGQDQSSRSYGDRDYGYGRQRDESFGHQLREAGQRFIGKVKRAFRGPKGYKRSDDRIREDVNDRLSLEDHLDPSEIEVSVSNGEVTLTGSVETRREKFLAEEIADDVSGVTEVHNSLRVGRAATQSSAYAESTSTSAQTGTQAGTEANRNRNARSV